MTPKEFATQGYLINNQITPDVLAAFPQLLDKANPDPDLDAELVEVVQVPGRPAGYRVRTWLERTTYGPACYPLGVRTLTEIRTHYVALPT